MTRMTKNNVDIWHKMRFIAIPVLAIAAHFLMSNILYYAVENLFLNVLHIPEAQFVKFAYLGELLVYIALILIFFVAYKIIWKHEENEAGTEMNLRDSALSFMAGVGVTGISFLWIMDDRSEERRVGKECRSRWSPYH